MFTTGTVQNRKRKLQGPPEDGTVSERAYELWMERGSSEEPAPKDWFETEQRLREDLDSEDPREA